MPGTWQRPGCKPTASSSSRAAAIDSDYLELADWRRRVAEAYARWRAEAGADPQTATQRWRETRDALFREHPQSPLPIGERAGFAGLPYFDYDPAYRLTARLEPDESAPADPSAPVTVSPLALPVSGTQPFAFRRVGRVRLGGPLAEAVLSVFWLEGYGGGIFLPFRDATSGGQTYGAGRYLLDTVKGADLGSNPATGELLLDFNMAYHPSCAYDPRWNCPLAPRENWLTLAVPAGERLG